MAFRHSTTSDLQLVLEALSATGRRLNSDERVSLTLQDCERLLFDLRHSNADFVGQIRSQVGQYDRLGRNVIETKEDPYLLAAFFKSRIAPWLNFEFLLFDKLPVTSSLVEHFPANAIPVKLRAVSDGLKPKQVVALFPEDWRYPVVSPGNDTDTIYFISRFTERFFKFSLPILQRCIATGTFENLKSAAEESDGALVERLCSDWMWIHEHGHQQGEMPFSDYGKYKNSFEAGAFEEMRADMFGISRLLRHGSIEPDYRVLLAEFILFERIVRYPIQCLLGEPRQPVRSVDLSYDAIGSQVLFYFLEDHGYLSNTGGSLVLADDWEEGLEKYLTTCDACERKARLLSPRDGKLVLEEFVRERGGYDQISNRYVPTPFHQDCAAALTH